ncbi:hypothetical protein, partial [Campylobacter jejuni]|uniref:hypothetical protein n=1 Tax=Campylobacter jejuni TaxID=197 RepID=UPI001F097884
YEINEGDGLSVSGSAFGTPTGYGWRIGKGSYSTSSVSFDWSQLIAVDINDNGTYVLTFNVSYTEFSSSTVDVAKQTVNLVVHDVAPTIT